MLTVLTQSVTNAAFGIYMPKFLGSIYELLSAPVNFIEGGNRLRGRSGDQGLDDRSDHPCDLDNLSISRSSTQYGCWGSSFSPASTSRCWVHHRHLGQYVRTAATGADADHYALGLSGRNFLFDLDAAGVLAEGDIVQSGRLSGVRVSAGLSSVQADVAVGWSLLAVLGFTVACLGAIWWIFRTGWKIRT